MTKVMYRYLLWMMLSAFAAFSLYADGTNLIENISYGIPGTVDVVVCRMGYAVGFVNRWRQAAWVSYRLTREEVEAKAVSRGNDFRKDVAIPYSAKPSDYLHSGYDKGHLAPAADMQWSSSAMSESFLMSNMSPQRPAFNRGIWASLEGLVRRFAQEEASIFVVTGPIVTERDATNIVGDTGIVVPSAFYKVVIDETPPLKAIGFIVPNSGTKEDVSAFVRTVSEVEKETGLDFFSMLPPDISYSIETNLDIEAWGIHDMPKTAIGNHIGAIFLAR